MSSSAQRTLQQSGRQICSICNQRYWRTHSLLHCVILRLLAATLEIEDVPVRTFRALARELRVVRFNENIQENPELREIQKVADTLARAREHLE